MVFAFRRSRHRRSPYLSRRVTGSTSTLPLPAYQQALAREVSGLTGTDYCATELTGRTGDEWFLVPANRADHPRPSSFAWLGVRGDRLILRHSSVTFLHEAHETTGFSGPLYLSDTEIAAWCAWNERSDDDGYDAPVPCPPDLATVLTQSTMYGTGTVGQRLSGLLRGHALPRQVIRQGDPAVLYDNAAASLSLGVDRYGRAVLRAHGGVYGEPAPMALSPENFDALHRCVTQADVGPVWPLLMTMDPLDPDDPQWLAPG